MNEGDIKPKSDIAKKEEEILKFWNENKIFEKTLAKENSKGDFVFYDGPPFATGLPHFGHILASTIKDAVPRYKTMQGFHVARKWGWDCHGLPIENIVEKDLKVSGKKEIEALGVEKFNEYARSKVLGYVHEWKKTVERIGRWVDFDGSYKTMDNTYMESVWCALKEFNKKHLIYEGTKVLPYCPRCETPIAQSEIAMDNSYKDITDISVYVKFKLVDEVNTYLLAWTTTPWTLPGNFAIAVNNEIAYVKIKDANENFVIAKDLFEKNKSKFKDPQVEEEFKGESLVGKLYVPVFNYFTNTEILYKDNAWKVYAADFVTTESGTGIVHIAPGYGEDDMNLAKKENIPFIHHVGQDGKFKEVAVDFAGIPVKPKDDHQSGDVLIIKFLAKTGNLFAKEKIIHPYPHCFRCETPLIYYAISAWFIKIQEVKEKLLSLNENIHWIPEHLKEGRFRKSMEGAPDWNISRNRFWATALPFWKCSICQNLEVIGSLEDLKNKTKRNNYIVMRHGEGEHNISNIMSSIVPGIHHLTEKGKKEVEASIKSLEDKKIDLIFYSPLLRTEETAYEVSKALDISIENTIVDERLREESFGELEGHPFAEYWDFYKNPGDRLNRQPKGGENLIQIHERVTEFLYDIDSRFEGKNILIVSHDGPIKMMKASSSGFSGEDVLSFWDAGHSLKTGNFTEIPFTALPHNKKYEIDLHRPYIDEIKWKCECGGVFQRIPEVIDCWFESGSMPFSQFHAPFENEKEFKNNFPADFVAEYIAQTRTWFYYMHVVSTVLFDQNPFKNVVTTGNVLAEDGEKMSKSKNNFPDPWIVFDTYSVDALRYYLLISPIMRSEDLKFSEKGVDEVQKKVINRLNNVLTFYETYMSREADSAESSTGFSAEWDKEGSKNVLDQWMIARFNQIAGIVTYSLDKYELDKAARPIADFVDDLSTWYLRRSRDRFKSDDEGDKQVALSTTKYILQEFSKIIAPFMPFLAEDVYRRAGGNLESVHLESWPNPPEVKPREIPNLESRGLTSGEPAILLEMTEVRKIVSLGLEARAKAGIKVRQPLSELKIRTDEMDISENADYLELIKDEVNVKEVILDAAIENDVVLDTNITEELKEEGNVRELMRAIQDLRKEESLQVADRIILSIEIDADGKALIEKFQDEIKKVTGLKEIKFEENDGGEMKIDTLAFKLKIAK